MALPKIIYGTAWKKERTAGLVVQAVLQGFRAIDTACQPKHYNEPAVGEALEILQKEHGIKREDIWLQTKFTSILGQDRSKPLPYDPNTPITTQVHTSFLTSLKNLHTTYVDSFILHSPLSSVDATLEAWKVLMELQDQGRVKMIGVSNTYDVKWLEILGELRKVQVVQNRWYERNNWDSEVCGFCLKEGIMYQSFWTLTGSPALLEQPFLIALATRYQKTPAQILFRVAQYRGITPLAGSTDEGRMKDGVEATNIAIDDGKSDKELRELVELTRG